MFHYVACGLPNVWLENGYTERVSDKGESFFTVDNIKDLHAAIGRTLVDKDTLLTGDEFRYLRSEMRLSRKALGECLGYSDETIKKWESGENSTQKTADAALRMLYKEQLNEDSKVNALLKRINHLEKKDQELRFKELNGDWQEERQYA